MPFPPPTDGFVEQPAGETLNEYLIPKPGCTRPYLLEQPFHLPDMKMDVGDYLVLEQGRNPHQGCIALVELSGDVFLCRLHYQKGIWYAETEERRGRAPEDMVIQGIARHWIKNQLDEPL